MIPAPGALFAMKLIPVLFGIVFTGLHVMQTRYSEKNFVCPSVRPSVRPSVTRVIPDKTEERFVQIFIPYERIFILVF